LRLQRSLSVEYNQPAWFHRFRFFDCFLAFAFFELGGGGVFSILRKASSNVIPGGIIGAAFMLIIHRTERKAPPA
jgi:hypothetical protein